MAVRQVNRILPRKKIPLMGLSAAFIFAAQMLNFPVAGGTSGHVIGSVLVAVLLGPSAAVIVLSVLYLAAMFSLGLFISTRTHKTSLALLAGFFAWIFLTFIIPKTGEPLAGLIRRIPSEDISLAYSPSIRTESGSAREVTARPKRRSRNY